MGEVRQLPLLPLRDLVLFPHSEAPIYIGREASLRAIKLAKAQYGDHIAVFTQLKGENNGPLAASDINHVGTLAKIVASVEMTDQTIKGMLEGIERVRLQDMKVEGGVTLLTVVSEPETYEVTNIDKAEQATILELLSTWGLDLSRAGEQAELQTVTNELNVVSVVAALRSLVSVPRIDKPGAERGWESINNQPSARYRDLKNQAVARRQKVLEEPGYRQKLQHIIDALRFDIACRAETALEISK